MAFAGGKLRSSSHSGSSASGEKRRPRSTASSTSTAARGLARRIRDPDRPTLNTPGSVAASSPAVQSSPGGVRQASRSRSPEANAPVQDLTDRIVSQIMSRRLVQESDMEDLRFNVMSILQPALKKSSFEETQRLSIELQEARSRTAHARTEIARLKSEAQTLEQKSVEAEEKGRRAETRASKAEARLKSSLQDPLMIKVGSETVEVRSSTSRAKDTMEVLAEEQRKMEKELHQLKSKADTNKSATIRVVTQLIGYNNNRLNNLLQAAVFGLWRTTAKERFSQKQAKTQQAQEEEARKKRQLHGDAKAKFIATLVEGKRKQLVFAQCLRAWSQLVYENHLETARHKQEEQHKEEFKQLKSKADRNMLATSERMAMQLDRMALQLMSRDTDQVLAAVVGSWKIATQEGKFLRQQAAEKHKMQQEISQLQSKAERNMLASSERTATQRISPTEGHEAEKEEPAAAAKKEEEPEAPAKKKREVEALKEKSEAAEKPKMQQAIDLPAQTEEKPVEAEEESRRAETRASKAEAPQVETVLDLDEKDEDASIRMVEAPSSTSRAKDAAVRRKQEEQQKEEAQLTASKSASSERTATQRISPAEGHEAEKEEPAAAAKKEEEPEATAKKKREAEALKQKLEEEQLLRQQAAERHKLQEEATAEKKREAEALKQKLEEEQLLRQQAAERHKLQQEATAEKRREAEALKQKLEEEQLLRQQAAEKHKLQQEATAEKEREAEALKQKLEEEQLLRQQAEKEEPAAAAKKVDKPEAEKKEPAAAAAEEEEGEETEATAEKRREAEALKQKLEEEQLLRQQAAEKHKLQQEATAAKKREAEALKQKLEEEQLLRQQAAEKHKLQEEATAEKKREAEALKQKLEEEQLLRQQAAEKQAEEKRKVDKELHQLKSRADTNMVATMNRVVTQLIGQDNNLLQVAVFGWWRTAAKEENLSRKQANAQQAHEEEVRQMRQLHGDAKDKFMATLVEGRRKILLFNSARQCLTAWNQLAYENHLETVRQKQEEQHKEEFNKFKYKADRYMLVTRDRMAMQLISHDTDQVLAAVVGSWKTATQEGKFLRQQAAEKYKMQQEFNKFQSKADRNMLVTRERMAMQLIGHDASHVLAAVVGSWKMALKEGRLLRQQATEKHKMQQDLNLFKSKAEKNMMVTSHRMAMALISHDASQVLAAVVGSWKTVTKDEIFLRQQAAEKLKANEELRQFKSKAEKNMMVTRDRMALQLIGQQKSHVLAAVVGLWKTVTKDGKLSRQQAERERLHKIEMARVDGLWKKAANDKAFRAAARFFQNHLGGLLLDIFLQWSIWVEVSRREKKVEEANQAHEEEVRKMRQVHGDRRARLIATTVQGRERMLLFSSLKHCLRAWSQLVFESHVETVRHEQDQKHREELNGVKGLLKHHCKQNAFYALLSKELGKNQLILQHAIGVWKEFRAEQVVQSIYEEKIAKLTTQFEDDAAELMHVQSLKIYSLKMALAEVKAKSHRKLLIQYCLQKWDDCKYQRQLEDKLMQVNEKHEDELAELVHAQGLTKHRLRSLMQERFLTGVIRQELQRHFLAWSHVKRLVASTAAELLLVAKAKQQLEKDMKVRKLKAFRTKERVVSHTGKNIDFIRLKDLWLAWWVQVIAHRFEVQQKSLKKLHGEEIRRLRAEALQEQQALGERMHRELEQVGRKAYLRELLSQWQIVVKKLRSHRSFHQEMDQIRKEAQVEVIKKEERTVERLSMVAVHSAELPVRRRAKEKRSSSPAVGHCPTCRAEMHLADLHPQQALRSLLDELPVSCPHGCGWTGRRDALKAHQAPGPGQCIRMQEEIAFLTEAQLEAHVAEQDEQATW